MKIFDKLYENQLRKNLTLMTIEAESRKAESATLSSQINKLEGTVRVTTKLYYRKGNMIF